MNEELHAWTSDRLMGRIVREPRRDRMTFVYDEGWRTDATSYPLSLSMPLSAESHSHDVISPFLWGLLPDNDGVLRRWGERFHVSPGNVFRLLEHVGEDCAGAVQLVKPERIEVWRAARSSGRVQWLNEDEIAACYFLINLYKAQNDKRIKPIYPVNQAYEDHKLVKKMNSVVI